MGTLSRFARFYNIVHSALLPSLPPSPPPLNSPAPEALNVELARLRASRAHLAAHLFSARARRAFPDAHDCAILLDCCRRLRSSHLGSAYLSRTLKSGHTPDTPLMNSYIALLCSACHIPDAYKVFNAMPQWGCPHSQVTYCTLIASARSLGALKVGIALVGLMLKVGCPLNTVLCNSLITGFCRWRLISDLSRVLAWMGGSGFTTDSATYNPVIGCSCTMGRVGLGFGFLARMLKEGIEPNTITYTVLIDGLCVNERIFDVGRLFVRMQECGCEPDAATYITVIGGYCRAGWVEMGLGVVGGMLKGGRHVDGVVMNVLVNGMCIIGEVASAVSLVKKMSDTGYSVDVVTYNTLLKGLCLMRNFSDALKLLEVMTGEKGCCKADVVSYNTVIDSLCKHGMVDEVRKLLDKMQARGLSPDLVTFRAFSGVLLSKSVDGGRWSNGGAGCSR